MNSSELSIAIMRTLVYHSIFDYPLSPCEALRYLIGYRFDDIESVITVLDNLPKVRQEGGRYYLTNRTYHFNQKYSENAWAYINVAQEIAFILSNYIKGIRLIAVSGSTAALNSNKESDIDLFIISDKNKYWTIRFSLLSILKITDRRVNTKEPKSKNSSKFCANYFIEDTNLTIDPIKQDLYTAMEIAHLKVIVNNDQFFQRFLLANPWIEVLLPNFWNISRLEWPEVKDSTGLKSQNPLLTNLTETISKRVQIALYSLRNNKKLTSEPIWTTDYRSETLKKYKIITEKLENKPTID